MWKPRSKLLKILGFGNTLKIKLQKMYLTIEYWLIQRLFNTIHPQVCILIKCDRLICFTCLVKEQLQYNTNYEPIYGHETILLLTSSTLETSSFKFSVKLSVLPWSEARLRPDRSMTRTGVLEVSLVESSWNCIIKHFLN